MLHLTYLCNNFGQRMFNLVKQCYMSPFNRAINKAMPNFKKVHPKMVYIN